MRESQYIGQYLGVTDSGTLWTPGTFLAYRLRGKAKQYAPNYEPPLGIVKMPLEALEE